MTKSQIQFHSDGYRPAHPAVNVKVRNFVRSSVIAKAFGCSEEQAERAGEFAFNNACERFWQEAQELCDHELKEGKVYSEGRSSGWLVVHGLPSVESWDALRVSAWNRFVKSVTEEVAYLTSEPVILDAIRGNDWWKSGSEEYNFRDMPDGSTVCLADLKQQAIAAGFGPVVR